MHPSISCCNVHCCQPQTSKAMYVQMIDSHCFWHRTGQVITDISQLHWAISVLMKLLLSCAAFLVALFVANLPALSCTALDVICFEHRSLALSALVRRQGQRLQIAAGKHETQKHGWVSCLLATIWSLRRRRQWQQFPCLPAAIQSFCPCLLIISDMP